MHNFNYEPIRAVVIIPPIEDFYTTSHRLSSLGPSVLVHILNHLEVETLLIDGLHPDFNSVQIPLPDPLSYLSPHILPEETGKCSFFRHYYHFGASFSSITTKVAHNNPDLCFIACFAYCYSFSTIELSKKIKQSIPNVIIVAGGAGVTVYPEHFLRNETIDYTLSGEAEITIPPFIDFIRQRHNSPEVVPALGWKSGRRCYFSPINRFTTTSSMLPIVKKNPHSKKYSTLTASLSRGCPHGCTFCANHLTHGNHFRHCSIDQLKTLLTTIKLPTEDTSLYMNFEDDNLLYDLQFFRSALLACKSRFRSIFFSAENGLDYRLLTPSTCSELIGYGFRQFNFTVGSVTPDILESTSRITKFKLFDELLHSIANQGIPVVSYIICGLPSDTIASIAANLRFLLSRTTLIGISLFYAVPGIHGFENRSFFDTFSSQLLCGSSAYPWNNALSTETLITAFRLARFINLMKNPVKTDEDKELITLVLKTGSLHTIIKHRRQRKIIKIPFQDKALVKMVVM